MGIDTTSLPKSWSKTSIGEIREKIEQRVPEDDEKFIYIDIGSVNRESKTITCSEKIFGAKAPSRARKCIKEGDTLISMTRPNLNAVALVSREYCGQIASTGFDVVRCSEIDSRWLFYLSRERSFVDNMSSLVQGALYPAVKSKNISDYEIPLAPLNEQRRIADKLDTTLAAVEACKQKLNNAAEIIQRFRQSVLAAAVSGELTREWREERHLSEPISTTLGEILKVSSGKFLRSKDMRKGGKVPVYGGNGINGYHDSGNTDGKQLIIGRVGYHCGSIHTTSGPAWITDNALITSFDRDEIQFDFLAYSLKAVNLRQSDSSTAQPVISGAKIYPLKIKLPSTYEEQNLIAIILDEQLKKAKEVEDKVEAALILIKKTEQSLLAKAFRGELVSQDPNDEPAAVLLERIKAQREAEAAAQKPAKRGRKKKAVNAQLTIPAGIADNHLAKVSSDIENRATGDIEM